MNFARKTRAVVWAIITLVLFATMLFMFAANIFHFSEIPWPWYIINGILIIAMWIASPEDPDETENRRGRKR
jgi:ABC-type branched-subunit amino acid transport system permease subunit